MGETRRSRPVESVVERRHGVAALMGAFTIWGFLPLYLHSLRGVPPTQIMAHRLVWCSLFVLGWLGARGELASVVDALRNAPTRWVLAASALLISLNWLTYVWAVSQGHVVEASLGYFINPLVNVVLGVALLRERLSRSRWVAVALAGCGVVYLTWVAGRPPWIAIVLALSFGGYGLLRKTVPVDALVGLCAETLLIAPLGVAYLLFVEESGVGALHRAPPLVWALLPLGGPLTAIPLALFAFGARRVPYSTVGIVQYIGPSLQLLLGVLLYREPFTMSRAVGFAMIWVALGVYGSDGLVRGR